MRKEKKTNKVVVTDLFMDCYKHFNVYNQVEKINQLSERELYLLLTLCLDKHDDANLVVKENFASFEKECMEIFEVQDDKEVTNQVLLDLIKETNDTYIETENIFDSEDNKVCDVFTIEEIRDIRIDLISEKK